MRKLTKFAKPVDIVDLIGEYVQLKKKDAIILAFALFMVRTLPRFPFQRKNKSSTVLVVGQAGIFLPS